MEDRSDVRRASSGIHEAQCLSPCHTTRWANGIELLRNQKKKGRLTPGFAVYKDEKPALSILRDKSEIPEKMRDEGPEGRGMCNDRRIQRSQKRRPLLVVNTGVNAILVSLLQVASGTSILFVVVQEIRDFASLT